MSEIKKSPVCEVKMKPFYCLSKKPMCFILLISIGLIFATFHFEGYVSSFIDRFIINILTRGLSITGAATLRNLVEI